MKSILLKIYLFIFAILLVECKKNSENFVVSKTKNENLIHYAKGLEIMKYKGFSVIKVSNPWPKANKSYTYILEEKNGIVPDSLRNYTTIQVPIKSIIVTSTTHISSLEMLGVENSLVGFPNLNYISSKKVRSRIDTRKVREIGNNQDLNTEVIIDISPSVIVGFGIDNNNPTLDNLEKSGIKVMLNGDWNEQTPLGKAEWIKFFGALYGLDQKAAIIFSSIEKEYNKTAKLALNAKTKPTVLAGAMFENIWYMPEGKSWSCYFIKEAQANYIWRKTNGTGSLSLSFESVLEKAKEADFWIGPGQFTSLKEMEETNKHYTQFKAFQNKEVYSFSIKKGKTGGVLYYELAPNRPDLVLKDMLKITHPELLPDYKLSFFEKLK